MVKRFAVAMLFVALLSSPAFAAPNYILDAANAYKSGEVVYVDPSADLASQINKVELTARIRLSSIPIFIVVLPQEALLNGPADDLPLAIGRLLPVPVAVGSIAGSAFRANAVNAVGNISPSQVGGLATVAFNAERSGGVTAVLNGWIMRMDPTIASRERHHPAPLGESNAADPKVQNKETSRSSILWFFVILGLCGGIAYYLMVVRADSSPKDFYAEVKNDTPKKVVVGGKRFRYSKEASGDCSHYSAGGYYDGRYVQPGYYSDPFWTYMTLSAVMNASHHNDHYQGPAAAASVAATIPVVTKKAEPTDTYYPPQTSGGGSFSAAPSSGGGDFSPAPSSGGGDWSSGGGSFGDGGSSSGGSGSGGGDFN